MGWRFRANSNRWKFFDYPLVIKHGNGKCPFKKKVYPWENGLWEMGFPARHIWLPEDRQMKSFLSPLIQSPQLEIPPKTGPLKWIDPIPSQGFVRKVSSITEKRDYCHSFWFRIGSFTCLFSTIEMRWSPMRSILFRSFETTKQLWFVLKTCLRSNIWGCNL